MFTNPELARVGLNESEAKRRGIAYRLAKLPTAPSFVERLREQGIEFPADYFG